MSKLEYGLKITTKIVDDVVVDKTKLNIDFDEVSSWPEILLLFAEHLNSLPDDRNFFINLDILSKHIENASREQFDATWDRLVGGNIEPKE